MKTATIPPLRVDPALREAAESVLQEGETLSSLVEESLRANIARRQMQREFTARGMMARENARKTGDYVDAREFHDTLRAKLNASKPRESDH
jgi:hypothetical protein